MVIAIPYNSYHPNIKKIVRDSARFYKRHVESACPIKPLLIIPYEHKEIECEMIFTNTSDAALILIPDFPGLDYKVYRYVYLNRCVLPNGKLFKGDVIIEIILVKDGDLWL